MILTRREVRKYETSGLGSIETIEKIGRNLGRMEERRKFKFTLDKSKYMIVKTERKKTQCKPKIYLKDGQMKECTEYTYLGNIISSNDNIGKQLDARRTKS